MIVDNAVVLLFFIHSFIHSFISFFFGRDCVFWRLLESLFFVSVRVRVRVRIPSFFALLPPPPPPSPPFPLFFVSGLGLLHRRI